MLCLTVQDCGDNQLVKRCRRKESKVEDLVHIDVSKIGNKSDRSDVEEGEENGIGEAI